MDSEEDIEKVITDYFKDIFTSSNSIDLNHVLNSVDLCITSDMAAFLQKTFTKEEMLESLYQIHPTKASGLDGMLALFYHKF